MFVNIEALKPSQLLDPAVGLLEDPDQRVPDAAPVSWFER